MKKYWSNNSGYIIVFYFSLFLVFNTMLLFLINEQERFLDISQKNIEKDKAMVISDSGFHIALAEIACGNFPSSLLINEIAGRIDITIVVINEKMIAINSVGTVGESKSEVNATIELNEENEIKILERRIW